MGWQCKCGLEFVWDTKKYSPTEPAAEGELMVHTLDRFLHCAKLCTAVSAQYAKRVASVERYCNLL